jgi:hypothetical protein
LTGQDVLQCAASFARSMARRQHVLERSICEEHGIRG